ncbi:MAG: hypothetical protein LBB72_06000 [Spirochaetaceae bacterium]|jgi:hypothetical protein|nr:hypothetical protein [Spirochaetaceae bacterium]
MIGLLLRKFLYDMWDNLFMIVLLNFGFLLFLSLAFLLPLLLPAAEIVLLVIMIYWLFVYVCAATAALGKVSDYRRLTLVDFAVSLKGAFIPALVLFAAAVFIFFIMWFTIPFYFRMGGMFGLAGAFFSFWLCVFFLGALQFYPAVYYRLGMRPMKSLKKCIVIFFDNTGFCVSSLIINIILTAMIIPFPCLPFLYLDEGLRLRIFKYDWLDAHAAEQDNTRYQQGWRKIKIPWAELLEEEKEMTGKRTWKSFIFPWKD